MTITERDRLILNYLPLARKMASQTQKKLSFSVDVDELYSAAYFALVEAASKCKTPKQKLSFGAYAKLRIHGQIVDYLRSQFRYSSRNSEEITEATPSKHYQDDLFVEEVANSLKNDLDRSVFLLYYKEGFLLKEIASQFNLCESSISKILKNTREAIKHLVVQAA